jgi:cellulose synthase/poly-beta-1,6-N-acetylglucosamine synthase-like glycosyltransferase
VTELLSVEEPAAAPAPSVSVIVCAYTEQRWADLRDGMTALREQTVRPSEVLLVVDHAEELLLRARDAFPSVRVIPNAGPRGLSAARNSGVAEARGEILAFVDDDALPARDWLEHLIEPYADPDVVAVGGSATPRWPLGRPGWFPEEFDWVVGCSYRGMPTSRSEIRNLMGCNMSFRADVLAAETGFPVGVGRVGLKPMGCEETELCIRIRQRRRRARIVFEPKASVRHRVTPERTGWNYFVARCFAEGNSKALVAKHVGTDDALQLERSYCLRTLPTGVLAGIRAAARGKYSGLARAAAIMAGLTVTAAGYGGASARRKWLRGARARNCADPIPAAPAAPAR